MNPEWYGKNYGDTHFGIAKKGVKYFTKEYEHNGEVPSDIVLPQPLHDNIADRMKPSFYYPKNTIKFEWKASWVYYDFHFLTIYYKEVPVQFIKHATADVVLQYINEYLVIEEIEILRRQVSFLQSKVHNVELSLKEAKTKLLTLEKINKDLLSSIKDKLN